MTALFEWLFKYRPLLYERGTVEFQPLWPSTLTWLLVAAALLIPYLIYRRAGSTLSNSWRYGFAALRAALFLVILLILLQPTLRIHSVAPQQNFVAIAYDLSRSMDIQDEKNGRSRLEAMKEVFRPADNPLVESLSSKFKLRYFSFSGSAERSAEVPEESKRGDVTDLTRALNQISEEMADLPVAGIVLATDGADNHSSDLNGFLARFQARGIPVYSVGAGEEDFPRDAEILKVSLPGTVLKDTVFEAEVSVRASGYAGRAAKLMVTDQGRPIQSQEIVLGADNEIKTFKINVGSRSEGSRILQFRLEPLPGEMVEQNNVRTALVTIEDAKPEILYVEGEPRWEYGFLRRAIEQDKNLRLITLLRQADGTFKRQGIESPDTLDEGFPTERAELFKYKAIVLGSVEASFFTFDQLRMISDFVSQRGGGFLMLGGRNAFAPGGYANTPLEDLLPVQLGRSGETSQEYQNREFKVVLTRYGEEHPVCRLSLSESLNTQRWKNAPNLIGFNATAGPKPGATVLARGNVPGTGGQNPVILAFQRFGKGRSAAFATSSSWRWRMELDHEDNFHEQFWRQMLRWLVSDVPDPLDVRPEKSSYARGDVALLKVEANDGSFLPLNNVAFSATIKAPSGQTTAVPVEGEYGKDGMYAATFNPQEEGIHEFSCEAFEGEKSLGTARAYFRVAESEEEFHDASLNDALLRRISSETGGRYYALSGLGTLAEDISFTDKGVSRIEELDLWDMPFLFLLLIGLASTEWTFRKRKGLS